MYQVEKLEEEQAREKQQADKENPDEVLTVWVCGRFCGLCLWS